MQEWISGGPPWPPSCNYARHGYVPQYAIEAKETREEPSAFLLSIQGTEEKVSIRKNGD